MYIKYIYKAVNWFFLENYFSSGKLLPLLYHTWHVPFLPISIWYLKVLEAITEYRFFINIHVEFINILFMLTMKSGVHQQTFGRIHRLYGILAISKIHYKHFVWTKTNYFHSNAVGIKMIALAESTTTTLWSHFQHWFNFRWCWFFFVKFKIHYICDVFIFLDINNWC